MATILLVILFEEFLIWRSFLYNSHLFVSRKVFSICFNYQVIFKMAYCLSCVVCSSPQIMQNKHCTQRSHLQDWPEVTSYLRAEICDSPDVLLGLQQENACQPSCVWYVCMREKLLVRQLYKDQPQCGDRQSLRHCRWECKAHVLDMASRSGATHTLWLRVTGKVQF